MRPVAARRFFPWTGNTRLSSSPKVAITKGYETTDGKPVDKTGGIDMEGGMEGGTINVQMAEAARSGDGEALARMLSRGGDPDSMDEMGVPLVTLAALACADGEDRALGCLVDVGANVDAVGRDGSTALKEAASLGLHGAVDALLRGGADPDSKAAGGLTPLMIACACGQGRCSALLVQAGADANARDAIGRTPLHHAALAGSMDDARLLLRAGANPNLVDDGGASPAQMATDPRLGAFLESTAAAAAIRFSVAAVRNPSILKEGRGQG